MNTFQLQCFLAVSDTLSFARAAEQMNISQPAITHQIKTLETELNAKLFFRSTRSVQLTPEGQAFRADAQSMVDIAEQAKLRFGDPREKPIERLSVGCISYNNLMLLQGCLKELARMYPNLHPHLVVAAREQLYQLLDNGALDVVFDIRDDAHHAKHFTFQELRKSPIVCICSSDHPLAGKKSVTRADIGKQPLIFCNPINLESEVVQLQWELAADRRPADLHFCASVEASVVLAGTGFGVAFLPEVFLLPEAHLSAVPLCDAPRLPFGVYYKPHQGDDVLKQFIRLAKKNFEQPEK